MLQTERRVERRDPEKGALNQSRQKVSLVERVAHLGTWSWTVQTGQLEWSEGMLQIYGLDRADFPADLLTVMREAVLPDDLHLVEQFIALTIAGGQPDGLECRIRRPDGSVRVICTRVGELVRDGEGRPVCVTGISQDVTERRTGEEALRESQAKLRAALASMTDAVLVTDAKGAFLDFNEAFAAFHRFECKADCPVTLSEYEQLFEVYSPDAELVPFEEWPLSRALRGERRSCAEYTIRRKDLGASWVGSYSFAPIRDRGDRIQGAVLVARDITEVKQAEQDRLKLQVELQHAQKLESIGRLAGGVAHDFNNMLAVILGHLELALLSIDPSKQLHDDLQQIQLAAERSAALTRQLLTFARQQTVAPRVLLLSDTVGGMMKMLQRLIGENIQLELKAEAGLWPVQVDPSQIDQVLANLCVNARDAITGVGKVTVELSNTTLSLADCASLPDVAPGDYVRLVVKDNGVGMDEETQRHLFEPFFTTKGVGRGTGLGLATVYGIVKQNQGVISVRSTPGLGSEFTIHLARHVGGAENAEGLPLQGKGHEVILLVEDEPAILSMTKRMLEQLGYFVLAAPSTSEAIALANQHEGKIDAVLTDVVMPEMNGRELAHLVESRHPGIRRLFMSGHTRDLLADQGVLDRGINFLQKPFTRGSLATKLRAVLDRA